LEQLSIADVPLSELRRPFERYAASGEVNRRVSDPAAVLGKVEEAFAGARCDHLDGLTVEYDDWCFNLRPSNTEPLLRLNVEAGDVAACEQRTNEVLAIVGGEANGRRSARNETEAPRRFRDGRTSRGPGPQAARDPRVPRGQ